MMEPLLTAAVLYAAFYVLRAHYQRAHVVLLGRHLAEFEVERHMESLIAGYMRALGESNEARQDQIWALFAPTEQALARQFRRVADAVSKEPQAATRISKWPVAIPYVEHLVPGATRDFRTLLQIHAAGMERTVANEEQLGAKDRAYQLSAEIFLMQHSCHWFCRSRLLADARLAAYHQVRREKVLASVSLQTRSAYNRWLKA